MSLEIHYTIGRNWLGTLLVAINSKGVCGLLLADDEATLVTTTQQLWSNHKVCQSASEEHRTISATILKWLESYDGQACPLPMDLDFSGTPFQREVWKALQEIPAGTTLSYGVLAAKIGRPTATRAVAGACAANRLAVIVPCHRVVRADGQSGGYQWGVERKRQLLARERSSSEVMKPIVAEPPKEGS